MKILVATHDSPGSQEVLKQIAKVMACREQAHRFSD